MQSKSTPGFYQGDATRSNLQSLKDKTITISSSDLKRITQAQIVAEKFKESQMKLVQLNNLANKSTRKKQDSSRKLG